MKSMSTILITVTLLCSSGAQNVFFNEIRSNDASTDDAEFIEIIGRTGSDVSGWTITHFNGTGASEVFSFTFPDGAVIPDDGFIDGSGQAIGFLVVKRTDHDVLNFDFEWGTTSLQNGPDGLLLQDDFGSRIQAITWNGLGDLMGGNPPWRDIGSDANDDNGLSAPDQVQESAQSAWAYLPATPGILNSNQSSGDISLPVQLTSFTARPGDGKVILAWITAAEMDNLGFVVERSFERNGEYTELASYETLDILKGEVNSSQPKKYIFVDSSVFNGITYWYKLVDVDVNGIRTEHGPIPAVPNVSAIDIDIKDKKGIAPPKNFVLKPNYPNPFNPGTKIGFDLPKINSQFHDVTLSIFNILGQRIITLFEGNLEPNSYELEWQGHDAYGRAVPSGIYFCILKTERYFASRKMILLR
jgi:hypothetical protein